MFKFIKKEISALSDSVATYFDLQEHYGEKFQEVVEKLLKRNVTAFFKSEVDIANDMKDG